jgi:hypothetical protein
LLSSLAWSGLQKPLDLIKNNFLDLIFADQFLMLLGSVWSLDCGFGIFCTQLLLMKSLKVLRDTCQVLELLAAHVAGIQIGAVHKALVFKKVSLLSGRIITLSKVASEWA